MKLTDHFEDTEFQCKHCGEKKICLKLVHGLEEARDHPLVSKIVVTSGYRCPDHPESKKRERQGKSPSFHTSGKAADVILIGHDGNPLPLVIQFYVLLNAKMFDLGGIGIYYDWQYHNKNVGGCHVDLGPCRRWTHKSGKYITGLIWEDDAFNPIIGG